METKSWTTIDKSGWGGGPWQNYRDLAYVQGRCRDLAHQATG
jgi:hypothetical protein